MKKKFFIVVLTTCTLILAACGKTEQTTAEVDTNPVTENTEAVETTAEPTVTETVEKTEKPAETEEPAEAEVPAAGPYDNLEDWVIGKDIWVYEQPDGERRVSNLPELAVKLPSKENLISIDEFPSIHEYNIKIPKTDNIVVVHSFLNWADNTDSCIGESMHKELTTYGRYTFDWGYLDNTANITVGCPDVDTSILISLIICKEDETGNKVITSDEAEAEFEKFVNINVEYVREQVQAWDQNYVPTGELSSANTSVNDSANNESTEEKELIVPEEDIPVDEEAINAFYRTYKQKEGSCEFTIKQGVNGSDTITASDGINSYELVMKVLGEGTYGVYSGDTEVFEIYEEFTGPEIYVIDDTYAAFAGIYE